MRRRSKVTELFLKGINDEVGAADGPHDSEGAKVEGFIVKKGPEGAVEEFGVSSVGDAALRLGEEKSVELRPEGWVDRDFERAGRGERAGHHSSFEGGGEQGGSHEAGFHQGRDFEPNVATLTRDSALFAGKRWAFSPHAQEGHTFLREFSTEYLLSYPL